MLAFDAWLAAALPGDPVIDESIADASCLALDRAWLIDPLVGRPLAGLTAHPKGVRPGIYAPPVSR